MLNGTGGKSRRVSGKRRKFGKLGLALRILHPPSLTVNDGSQVLHFPDVIERGPFSWTDNVKHLLSKFGENVWIKGEKVDRKC